MSEKMETIGSKPTGIKGIISGRIMNLIHGGLYGKIRNGSSDTIWKAGIRVLYSQEIRPG